MKTLLQSIVFVIAIVTTAAASTEYSTSPNDTWNAIKIFEGDFGSVTGDFDCQGISIGMAQWNIGKSFNSVKSIVMSNSENEMAMTMPKYGASFRVALFNGKDAALSFVRGLQQYNDFQSCDAIKRKASWTKDGRKFVAELQHILTTNKSTQEQINLRRSVYESGLKKC